MNVPSGDEAARMSEVEIEGAASSCSLGACPVCWSGVAPWRSKTTQHGNFAIVRCVACGFAFVHPRPSLEFLNAFYAKDGQGSASLQSVEEVLRSEQDYPNSTVDAKRMLDTIVRTLDQVSAPHPRRLLDVGCGYGFFSREALARGFDVCALEPASAERAVTESITGLRAIALPFEEFSDSEGSFAAILMSQILEHAHNVNQWVDKAHRLLVSEGVLAVALPNFASLFRLVLQDRDPYVAPPAHLNFFTPRSLSMLLQKHGFAVRKVQWVSRIDKTVLLRRVPAARFLGAGVVIPLRLALAAIDALHLGMMINIYSQKVATGADREAN